jgi:hypothetical protein
MTDPLRKRTPEDLAVQVRQWMLNEAPSTLVADGADRDTMVLGRVEGRFPGAKAAFGRGPILALTRNLEAGTCSWCAAAVIASGQEPLPDPAGPALQRLLGTPCRRCRVRHEMGQIVDRERGHLQQITAAGLRPAAASRARTPQQVQALAAAVKKLEKARPPVAPTGVLWAADQGEPTGLTAAARAAARRRRPNARATR